ncbi:MAG: DUF4340 domain-containing protein [Clostridia bacterium]|nr:DUF4340 domain-containing protein [Clostridia bacterium]
MNKKTTLLSRQKRIIIILLVLACVLAAAYFVIKSLGGEEKQTLYRIDGDGDEVFAIISDVSGKDRGINITYINSVLSGKAENRHNVKAGESEDILCTFEADDVKITYYPMVFPEVQLKDIDYVTVTNDYGYFKVYIDPQSGDAVIEQAKNNLYNSNEISTLLLQARYMLANSKLSNPSEKLSDYGLDMSQNPIKIEICDKKGNLNTVYMGNVTPNGGYYMKHKDKNSIYVMDSTSSVFENDVHYYLNPVITRSIPTEYAMYINTLSYYKDSQELFSCEIIPEQERVGSLKNQLHRIVSPDNKKKDILSTTTLYDMFYKLCSLSGVAVVEYDVSSKENYEEIMSHYGFAVPSVSIEYTLGDSLYYVAFGDRITDPQTAEVYYYAYGPYMDTIVLVPLSSVPFVEYQYIDFVHNKVFQHNIDDVAKITLTANGGTRVFITNGTGKDLSVIEQNTGKQIHVPSFRQFYISLVNTGVDGYSEIDAGVNVDTLEHNLTFEIELKNGEKLRYAFYTESTLRCYAVINGVGEFYTKREYVDKIAKFADMLMSGQVIPSQT